MTNTPELKTKRLILRRFNEDDIGALFRIYSDEEVNTFLPWFPIKSIKEAKEFYKEKYARAYELPRGYRYAVCLKSSGEPVGYVNLSVDENHDLGYGLRKEYWRQGIATEAARAVSAQAEKDGMLYITATHDINNPRSGSVMKALGMRYKYSYEELWQPKNFPVTFRMYQLNFDGNRERVYKGYWDKYENHFIEKNV